LKFSFTDWLPRHIVLLNYNVTKFQPSAYQISAAEFNPYSNIAVKMSRVIECC